MWRAANGPPSPARDLPRANPAPPQVGPALVNNAVLRQTVDSTQNSARGTFGTQTQAVVTSGAAATTSVGEIVGDKRAGDSQAAAYAEGMSRATGMQAFGLAVAQDSEGGGANAAADAIRRSAGYQGSSIAGDMFVGDSFGSSPAENAIRRTQADNAALQARAGERMARTDAFNI